METNLMGCSIFLLSHVVLVILLPYSGRSPALRALRVRLQRQVLRQPPGIAAARTNGTYGTMKKAQEAQAFPKEIRSCAGVRHYLGTKWQNAVWI